MFIQFICSANKTTATTIHNANNLDFSASNLFHINHERASAYEKCCCVCINVFVWLCAPHTQHNSIICKGMNLFLFGFSIIILCIQMFSQ